MKKTAIISVYDKTGIVKFASELTKLGFDIISTGGTYKLLTENNILVTPVEKITGFPEVLDGRVKTLHPYIFSGILANKKDPEHLKEIEKFKLSLLDLVVVSLYPFEETVKKPGVKLTEIIEQIDIGGVSLIRAAAKNYESINVLVDKSQYDLYINLLNQNNNKIPEELSQLFAAEAFDYINNYDFAISNYFKELSSKSKVDSEQKNKIMFSANNFIKLSNPQHLRYGENPDQNAVLYKTNFDEIFEVLHGKELSYNNLLDIDSAVYLINEFQDDGPTCAIVKHGNPCGVAVSENLTEAYIKALETDNISAFGGIVIFNRKLDLNTSIEVDKLFTEIIIAPDFGNDVLELLKKKKNRRLIRYSYFKDNYELKSITGGFLYQEKQLKLFDEGSLKIVTKTKPDEKQIDDMKFAVKIVKCTKSNAVVFVKDKKTIGIGGGQPSRVDSTKIAILKAKQFNLDLKDTVVASDAYFPFADSIAEISKAGSKAIIQPGGSVRDGEVIKAADESNISMAFSGIRYFRH